MRFILREIIFVHIRYLGDILREREKYKNGEFVTFFLFQHLLLLSFSFSLIMSPKYLIMYR